MEPRSAPGASAHSVRAFYDPLASRYHLVYEDWEAAIARQDARLVSLIDEHRGARATSVLRGAEGRRFLEPVLPRVARLVGRDTRTSRKGKLRERAGRFILCVQTKTLPHQYVSVEGPIVAVEAADPKRDRR